VTIQFTVPATNFGTGTASCNPGDYATGGGFYLDGTKEQAIQSHSNIINGPNPAGWYLQVYNSDNRDDTANAQVICQTPVTVAGIGVPEFGSFYVAIALGAILYFILSRRTTKRPLLGTTSATNS